MTHITEFGKRQVVGTTKAPLEIVKGVFKLYKRPNIPNPKAALDLILSDWELDKAAYRHEQEA